MSTPASGLSSYATPADFVIREDMRVVAQLLSDTDIPLTTAQVQNSPTLAALLMEASGELEASCTVGQRYLINLQADPPINDLAALTGNSRQYMIGLICKLTLGLLFDRRPERKNEEPQSVTKAREALVALEEGKEVFGLAESQMAGQLDITVDSPQVFNNRRGPVQIANRFFGRRVAQYQQQPPGG